MWVQLEFHSQTLGNSLPFICVTDSCKKEANSQKWLRFDHNDWTETNKWFKIQGIYFSLDITSSSKRTICLKLRSRKIVRFPEQIMSKDKYSSIYFFAPIEAVVYLLAVHIDLNASAGKVWFPLTNISFVIYKRLKLDFFDTFFGISPVTCEPGFRKNKTSGVCFGRELILIKKLQL